MVRLAIAIGVVILAAAPASAQFYGGFSTRSQFQFSPRGARFSFQYREFYTAPMFGYAWVPAYGPGYGPGFGNPFFLPPPPIIVGPPLIIPVGNRDVVNPDPVVQEPIPKSGFIVIAPRKLPEEGTISPMYERVMVPEKLVKPRTDPFAVPIPVGRTEPAADADAHVKQARAELAAGESGAAVETLDRALRLRPGDATTLYLKSQAQFAAGQYTEAVATIRAGMKVDAKWVERNEKPQDLLGKPARFDALLGDLKRSLDANPGSTALQFLLAHELWFNGERPAARWYFERLAPRLREADATDPFLK